MLSIAALALVTLVAAPAFALDLPKRKSGLWEIVTTRDAGAQPGPPAGGGPIRMCIDEKTDDLSRQMGESASKDLCSKREMQREGDAIVAHSVCRFGDTTATSRSVMTGSFDSAYEVDVRTNFEPPTMGMAESRTIIKARWVGPCAAGMRPGDVIMPGGAKINMFEAEKPVAPTAKPAAPTAKPVAPPTK
jgi:hypothetical protein